MLRIFKEKEKYILGVILFLGLSLRLYGAYHVAINHDEFCNDLPAARRISLDPSNIVLPMHDSIDGTPMAHRYLIKLGFLLFGNNLFGARIPFVLIGTFSIFLLYLIVKDALGNDTAMLAALLLSISQYHVGVSRLADYNSVHLLFVMLSLWLFYLAVKNENDKYFIYNSIIIGVGFWVKESIVILLPAYFIFLLLNKNKRWFVTKNGWYSICIMGLLIGSFFCVNLMPGSKRAMYIFSNAHVRISLNAIGFYCNEWLLLFLKNMPGSYYTICSYFRSEYPLLNGFLGICILIAVIMFARNKNIFIQILVNIFIVNFVIFSCISGTDPSAKVYWSLEFPDWSILGFIPGVVLVVHMFSGFMKKNRIVGTTFVFCFFLVMILKTVSMTIYPLHCYYPVRELGLKNMLDEYGTSWLTREGVERTKSVAKPIYEMIETMQSALPEEVKIAREKIDRLIKYE